jgi:hypothetical protein
LEKVSNGVLKGNWAGIAAPFARVCANWKVASRVSTSFQHEAAKEIRRLIEQPELWQRFGRISRQWAVEQFDLSVVADPTRSVYRQLLARKAALPAMES